METAARLVAMIFFGGVSVYCFACMGAVWAVNMGFTGRLGLAWLPVIGLLAVSAGCAWLAYWFAPFTLTIATP